MNDANLLVPPQNLRTYPKSVKEKALPSATNSVNGQISLVFHFRQPCIKTGSKQDDVIVFFQ
jgi:hypothetical protein